MNKFKVLIVIGIMLLLALAVVSTVDFGAMVDAPTCSDFIQAGPLVGEYKCDTGRSWADAKANWTHADKGWCGAPNYIGYGCLVNADVDGFKYDPALGDYGQIYGDNCDIEGLMGHEE